MLELQWDVSVGQETVTQGHSHLMRACKVPGV